MDLFQILNDGGITVLIVTHEPVVADHAERIIELRDGSLLRDERVERRTRASGMFADSAADANNGGRSP
jgi:putative ABC transport system ATP-binding protein